MCIIHAVFHQSVLNSVHCPGEIHIVKFPSAEIKVLLLFFSPFFVSGFGFKFKLIVKSIHFSISLFSYCLLVLFSFVSSVLCVVLLLLHFHCLLLSPPASYYPPVSNSLTALSHTDSAILPTCLS